MRHPAVLCATLGLGLTGCAQIHDTGMRLVATTVPAYAVINANLFSGTALLHVDRTGTVNLTSDSRPELSCMGRLRYTATTQGVIHLLCSDGKKVTLNFNAYQESMGHASGPDVNALVNLTFGMEAEMATAYLGMRPEQRAPASDTRPDTTARP